MAVLMRAPSALAVLFMLLVVPGATREQRTQTGEDDVKAAFLYNFTKFVTWPPSALRDAEPFRLCVVADPAFSRSVDRIIAGETVLGRRLERDVPDSAEAAQACHILFIGRLETDRAERWVAAVRSLPILVVGETPGFADRGGHIGFVVEDNRVRFDINQRAAAAAGLTISSKLLRVARNVSTARSR